MRELRPAIDHAGPFTAATAERGLTIQEQPRPQARAGFARRALLWGRHGLTLIGIVTVFAFAAGATPIPEMIGNVAGRIDSAATYAKADSQGDLAGKVAQGQQDARVAPEKELQEWQTALQADLVALTNALDGTKAILVQKITADLQARNQLLQTNAQLQADRAKQIMQLAETIERGNIASAQVIDMAKNAARALGQDAADLEAQSRAIKKGVMDDVTVVNPAPQDAGILAPLEAGGVLDSDVQSSLASLEAQIARIQQRFAIKPPNPRPIPSARP